MIRPLTTINFGLFTTSATANYYYVEPFSFSFFSLEMKVPSSSALSRLLTHEKLAGAAGPQLKLPLHAVGCLTRSVHPRAPCPRSSGPPSHRSGSARRGDAWGLGALVRGGTRQEQVTCGALEGGDEVAARPGSSCRKGAGRSYREVEGAPELEAREQERGLGEVDYGRE